MSLHLKHCSQRCEKNKALQAELDETKALLAEEREYLEMLSKSRSFSLHNES